MSAQWYAYMFVQNNQNDNSQLSANRTLLGVSKNPWNELKTYNKNTNNRYISMSNQFDINGLDIDNIIDMIKQKTKDGKSFDYSRMEPNVFVKKKKIEDEVEEEQIQRRNMRKKTTETNQYILAVITGPFENRDSAQQFCINWNERSRGALPRTAKAISLCNHYKIDIGVDFNAIFGINNKYIKTNYTNNAHLYCNIQNI